VVQAAPLCPGAPSPIESAPREREIGSQPTPRLGRELPGSNFENLKTSDPRVRGSGIQRRRTREGAEEAGIESSRLESRALDLEQGESGRAA
jgi:hypothetical protein